MFRELRLLLASSCPYACTFCHNEWQAERPRLLHRDLALAVADEAVRLGVRHIYLSGGEPLLYPELLPLLDGLRQLAPDLTVGMATNGSLRPPGWLEACGRLRVRLRFNVPSTHPDSYRRHTGGGRIAIPLQQMHAAHAAGIYVGLNTVWLGQDETELEDLVGLASRLAQDLKLLLWHRGPDRPYGVDPAPLKQWLAGRSELVACHGSMRVYSMPATDGLVRVKLVGFPCPQRQAGDCREFGEVRLLATGTLQGCNFGVEHAVAGLSREQMRERLRAAAATRGRCDLIGGPRERA